MSKALAMLFLGASLSLGGALGSRAASPDALRTAWQTSADIKQWDPLVRSVGSQIPANMGGRSACGSIGGGSLTAFYCTIDRSIYITERSIDHIWSHYGSAGVAVVVAHEFAHARLHAIQGFTREAIWTSVIDELQADCTAGVYLRQSRDEPLDEAMVSKAAGLLENLGDYVPLERDWHGSPEMRRIAFLRGYREGSLSTCAASSDVNFRQMRQETTEAIRQQIQTPDSQFNQLMQWGRQFLKP